MASSTVPAVHVLPAVIPEGEFSRAELVPVRLARKVGPLFGVRWPHDPFGRTWVCDFASLTLGEIARGAPAPSKEEQARLDGGEGAPASGQSAGASDQWALTGRSVWSPGKSVPPATLANATLNRFGPHTKAAVVLTAANRLLADATEAVASVARFLSDRKTDQHLALAVWAGLTLEAFRGQPALVVAAIQARAVQQSLTTHWGSQVAVGDLGETAAGPEIGSDRTPEALTLQPTRFALIDDTLDLLLRDESVDRRSDIAAAWCRRLLNMGRPGSGMIWLVEEDGHRYVRAYQRTNAIVAHFVAEVLNSGSGEQITPEWLLERELRELPPLTVRAHALAAHIAVNYQRYRDRQGFETAHARSITRRYLVEATANAVAVLGENDPVSLLLLGFQEALRLLDARQAGDGVGAAADDVLAGQRRTIAGLRSGAIDPGAASYLIEFGNVALEAVREQIPGLDRSLTRTWREALLARGLPADPAAHLDELTDSQVFHLAYYGQHLAARDQVADLRRALRILVAATEVRERVAASEPASLTAKYTASRDSHITCVEVALKLAERERDRAGREAARTVAAHHVHSLLTNPSTGFVLTEEDDARANRLLAAFVPALRQLLAQDALGPVELDNAVRLADLGLRRWESRKRRPADREAIEALGELRSDLIRTAETTRSF